MNGRMYCGGHGETLPCAKCATNLAKRAEPAVLTLSTPALLAEVNDGLALRVCRQQTTARDVLLVQALAARLVTASAAHARATNREPLEGMLMLDVGAPLETDEASTTISFRELQSLGWFGHAEQLP